jgi:hypothetical protein
LKKIKVFTLAESLGGVESLANHSVQWWHTHRFRKIKEGITDDLVRLSVWRYRWFNRRSKKSISINSLVSLLYLW